MHVNFDDCVSDMSKELFLVNNRGKLIFVAPTVDSGSEIYIGLAS